MFGAYCFGAVSSFQYLGSTVGEDLDEMKEIRRIAVGSRAYFAFK